MLISRRPKINCKEHFSVFFYCNSKKSIETVKNTLKVRTLKLDFLRRNGSEKLIFDFQSLKKNLKCLKTEPYIKIAQISGAAMDTNFPVSSCCSSKTVEITVLRNTIRSLAAELVPNMSFSFIKIACCPALNSLKK